MQRIIIPLFLLTLFSCHSGPAAPDKPAKESWRDSILERHLATVGQIPIYDTINVDYKMLVAYEANDSASLTKMETDFERRVTWYARDRHFKDSCTKQVPINKMNCLEAYRFDFDDGLCPYTTSLTIVRYEDSVISVCHQTGQIAMDCFRWLIRLSRCKKGCITAD